MVRLSQYGVPHIWNSSTVEVSIPGGVAEKINIQLSETNQVYFGKLRDVSGRDIGKTFTLKDSTSKNGEVVIEVGDAHAGFPAPLAVFFRNVKPGTRVKLSFSPCTADYEPHGITLMKVDRRGAQQSMLVWQDVDKFIAATANPHPKQDWFKSMADVLGSRSADYLDANGGLLDIHGYYSHIGSGTMEFGIEAGSSGTIKAEVKALTSLPGGTFSDITDADREKARSSLRAWCRNYATSGTCG
jgi:hypothetical protein